MTIKRMVQGVATTTALLVLSVSAAPAASPPAPAPAASRPARSTPPAAPPAPSGSQFPPGSSHVEAPPAPASPAVSQDAAARSRMHECGHQWSTMKKAGTAGAMTWKEFSATCLVVSR